MSVQRLPGVHSARTGEARRVTWSDAHLALCPRGIVIDGSKSRDPGNTGYTSTLRAGLLLGRITATGKWAPSILGVTAEAIDGAETAVDLPAAVVTELTRRVGASGTFKLVGPPSAGGTVRTVTATYSGFADADTVTITALGTAAVWTLTPTDGTDAGSFRLRVTTEAGVSAITAPIAFNATGATFAAAIDAAIEALANLPDTAVTVASADTTGVTTLTFLSSLGAVQVEVVDDFTNDGGVYEGGIAAVETTPGVSGEFVTGSLILPTDGSEVPRGILGEEFGLRVTDDDAADIDVQCGRLIVGGFIDTARIIDYPADAASKAWLKAQLRAYGLHYCFSDDFEG